MADPALSVSDVLEGILALAEKRLSPSQRRVLLSLSTVPEALSKKDAVSALCLEEISVAPDTYVKLVRGYWEIQRLQSTYFVKLTTTGEEMASRLRAASPEQGL